MTIQKLVYIIIYENADFGQLVRKKNYSNKSGKQFSFYF